MATAIARELPSWSGSQTLGNRPLLMRYIKLGGLRQQVMCAGHLLLLCSLCLVACVCFGWLLIYFQIPMVVVFPEKGKLKHAIVSSHPGETRDIRGYKVSSYALGRMTRSAAFPDHLVIVAAITGRYICCSAVCINQKFNLSFNGQQN
jgi:hypothetical protein